MKLKAELGYWSSIVGAVQDGNLFIDSDGDLCIAGRKNNLVACLATDDADGNWQPLNPDVFPEIVRRWNVHTSQPSETVAAVERAFDKIRELNMSGRDENGHRWANSDLIDQTVTEGLVALRALKGDDANG